MSLEWENQTVEQEMTELLLVRGAVLALLEKARGDKYVEPASTLIIVLIVLFVKRRILKSSLEAEVDLILPEDAANSSLVDLLQREGIHQMLYLFFGPADPLYPAQSPS